MGKKHYLSIFSLAMINVAAVLSLRNYPTMAVYGWSSVTWYLVGTVLFLLPLAFVSAELATGWPKGGGVYAWIKEAWGEREGFLGIWCEWSENLVWFPTVLAFIASTFAFVITPELATDRVYLIVFMLAAFWGVTAVNLFRPRIASRLTDVGVVAGSIVPATAIIVLAAGWLLAGKDNQIPFSGGALVPSFTLGDLPFVQTVVLIFTGMELVGFHALQTRDPRRSFPRAILLSVAIVLPLTIVGTVALATVVPAHDISLAAGLMQAFETFLDGFGIGWLARPLAVLVTLGALAELGAWVLGPAKGIGEAARHGDLPPGWRRENRNGVPVAVLVGQATISSFFALLYALVPSVNSAYWILTAMSVQVYCVMYLLLFAAAIKLRATQPETPRAYRVPGPDWVLWIVAGAGVVSSAFAFVVGFVPPAQLKTGDPAVYVGALAAGVALLSLPPLWFYKVRKPAWLDGTAGGEPLAAEGAP